ncbi:MAG: nucleoside kinase [Candidatus Neomarinimicrobiota bacterium]
MNRINVKINGALGITTKPGKTIRELLRTHLPDGNYLPFLTVKNDLFASLNETVQTDSSISTLSHFYESERRAYENTAILIISFIARHLFPKRRFVVKHSICDGVYCEFLDETLIKTEEIDQFRREFAKLVAENAPIRPVVWTLSDAIHHFMRRRREDTVRLLNHCSANFVTLYELCGEMFWFPNPLAPETGLIRCYELLPYDIGFALRVPVEGNPDQLHSYQNQSRLGEIFHEAHDWGRILELLYACDLNKSVAENTISDVIKIAEALHEKKIAAIADQIDKNPNRAQLVFVAGPSSSGKTTFMKRLYVQLRVLGRKVITLSLDNYFKDRNELVDEPGKGINFEALDAIDLKLLNEHLLRLLSGKSVVPPVYDFITGKKVAGQMKINADQNTIFIIEGIHGINPNLTQKIDDRKKFKIYISPLTHLNFDDTNRIPTHDTRLIRRIVRDAKYRGYSAAETIHMWKKVVEGEKKYIFTYQGQANVMFNSSLVYEIGALKTSAEVALKRVSIHDESYPEADRLLHFLSYFLPIEDDEIPPTSILREFIGKSSFVY